MHLRVIDGGLYIPDGADAYRNVEQTAADKPYRDAYRKLFRILNRWPPDGVYTYNDKGEMRPAATSQLFLEYIRKRTAAIRGVI